MPTPPKGFEEEVPVLTAHDESIARNAFVAEMTRELIMSGDNTPHVIRAINDATEQMVVTSRHAAPEVKFHAKHGKLNAVQAAQHLAAEANDKAAALAYGPDPVQLLVNRLVALGVDGDTANQYAPLFVRRETDGRVLTLDARTGEKVSGPAAKPFGGALSPDELSRYTDGKEQLAIATRQALALIEADKRRKPEVIANPLFGAF